MKFMKHPAPVMDRFNARQLPHSIEYLLANAPDAERREQVRLAFAGSAMDVIDRFFPTRPNTWSSGPISPSPRCRSGMTFTRRRAADGIRR